MRWTERLQEIRKMRFEEMCIGWTERSSTYLSGMMFHSEVPDEMDREATADLEDASPGKLDGFLNSNEHLVLSDYLTGFLEFR
jgi:hypothetical protein